jgi:peptidyl-prolyl cis-trans isomerase D
MFPSEGFIPTGEIRGMLDVLRRNAGSWAIKIILTFIALTFIWWGVGSYSQSRRDVAATVGGEKISLAELAETTERLEKTYREVYGNALTPEMARELNLRKQALDTLIRRKLLLAEAKKMGLSASSEEVRREIAATPAFQVDGEFREDRYRSILSYNRVSPADYETSRQQEITVRKLEGLLSASARVTPSEARDFFRMMSRKVRLLVVTSDPSRRIVPPATEGETAAKYEQTRESYRIPARVKLSVALFSPETFAREMKPSEQEIVSFYEGNTDKFRTEESRLVHPVTIPYAAGTREPSRKKVEEILAEARKGKDRFEEIAKKLSRGKGEATWLTRREMRPELADAVFSAPVDGLVGPIDTGSGFTIVRVSRIRFPETLPLAQVRDRVLALLKREKGKDVAVLRAYEAHGKARESGDLAGAVASFGVTLRETGWTSDGKGTDLPLAVVQEALLLQAGEIGPVKTVGDTHYLFRVDAKENSRIPSLPEVRGRIVAVVEKEKREAAARAELQQAIAGAKTASELERNAGKAGLAVTTTPFFTPLSGPLPGVLSAAGDIRRDLLPLSPKSPVSSKVFPAGEKYLAVAFVSEQPEDPKEWEAGKDSFIRGLREQKQASVLEAFVADRMNQSKVEINPEVLK